MATKKQDIYGVIGCPIGHTMSPIIHNTIFSSNNDGSIYLAIDVKPDELKSFIGTINALNIKGFNVTMPHKQAIMEYMDFIDDDALIYGSVNTVAVKDGKLYGYCTDPEGFYMSLEKAKITVNGKNIVFLGAGGVSRSVALLLAKKGAGKITLLNRSLQRAEGVRLNVLKYVPAANIAAYELNYDDMGSYLEDCDILINTTPLGMKHNPQFPTLDFLKSLKENAVVYDMIYNPVETDFLKEAKRLGHKTISGLYMLIYQGIIASKLFYGKPIPGDTAQIIADQIKKAL